MSDHRDLIRELAEALKGYAYAIHDKRHVGDWDYRLCVDPDVHSRAISALCRAESVLAEPDHTPVRTPCDDCKAERDRLAAELERLRKERDKLAVEVAALHGSFSEYGRACVGIGLIGGRDEALRWTAKRLRELAMCRAQHGRAIAPDDLRYLSLIIEAGPQPDERGEEE